MQHRDWRLRVEDVLEAIQRISRYTEDMSFEEFRQDTRTVDAVVRNLEVIGEAARYISSAVEEQTPGIPWGRMRAMRNILTHEYFGVDLAIIWETVHHDLPPLVPLLRDALEAGT